MHYCLSYQNTIYQIKLNKVRLMIWLVGRTLHSGNGGTLTSDNGGIGCISKVTSGKLRYSFNLC